MTVILFILVLMAMAVEPRVIAYIQSEKDKAVEGKLARLPAEALNESVQKQVPVTLRVSGKSIIMEDAPADGSQPQQVKSVELGDDFDVDSVQLNGEQSDTGTWLWTAYPDGTTDKAAVQFSAGKSHYSLVMLPEGTSQWTSGDAPDQTQDQWEAGALQQRS